MTDEAATPPGAESSARAEVSAIERPLSIKDRIKAAMAPPEPQEQAASPVTDEPESEAAPPKAEKPKVAKAKEEPAEEAPAEVEEEEAKFSSFKDLAEAAGLSMDDLFEFELPTKIDGKEGKARLRDMLKSFQLESHLNQKLMTHADEKKAFETERARLGQESQQKLQQLDAAVLIGKRLLDGEIANTDWQALQTSDPLTFNQKYVEMQQRQQMINGIADQLGQERQKQQEGEAAKFNAYRTEQAKLLDSKIPEWSDASTKTKQVAEMTATLLESYGITEKELKSQVDHRLILIARDAAKYQQLQKERPAVLKKITATPKLLKPGAQQSKATQDALVARKQTERLRSTGKVKDAVPNLKRLLFN